jgi:diguanylate cyclase
MESPGNAEAPKPGDLTLEWIGMLFWQRRTEQTGNPLELLSRLSQSQEREAAYHAVLRTLVVLIKDFALDIAELRTDRFLASLDHFNEQFFEQEKPRQLLSSFEKQKSAIAVFSERQRQYLQEREAELRNIIDLLTRAMVSGDTENDAYHRKILEQSEKMEQITRLDDIRKIKFALEREVASLRETVRCKQTGEDARMRSLSSQVETLRQELQLAKEESLRDALTDTYNRRAFDDHLQSLTERNLIQRHDFALLILDIDDFKVVNDSYGHPVGDRVLLAVADTCRQVVRSDDFLARYGGEEFVIVLPGASLRNATKKAGLICKTIHKTRYTLDDDDDLPPLSMTVSIGVTAFKPGDTPAGVLERADKALYKAKQGGKNTVRTA